MHKLKHIGFWLLAIIITLGAAAYQRATGPTHPIKVDVKLADQHFKFSLIRTQEIGSPCYIDVPVDVNLIQGTVFYKRLNVDEPWSEAILTARSKKERAFFGEGKEIQVLSSVLPEQPEAGKLEYFIELRHNDQVQFIAKEHPIAIRFKGAVPAYILAPHIFFMFLAMLLASITAIYYLAKDSKRTWYFGIRTYIALFIGGMILGPIVQKFAFSEFWTGVPFGWDLTDNKTLIAFVFWTIAIVLNRNRKNMYWFIVATIVLYAVYSIPHSAYGSEFDYETGVVTQGLILPLMF
ncbi:MAG: hypothetical protein JXR60_06100 [Bacteroidales bacterium]|nr:hypothetical protein [Bacteroidales bacterium]